jgi:hypothetical protein
MGSMKRNFLIVAGIAAVMIYQNCAPTSENTLSIPGTRPSGSTGGGGSSTLPCGPGTYRPSASSSCRSVSDTQYAPGDDGLDIAIDCPVGASSAGTPKGTIADCRPVPYFRTTPYATNSPCTGTQSEFPVGASVYGCVTGVAVNTTAEPQLQACVTVTCARPAPNSLPPANCQWVGFRQTSASPPTYNQQWYWSSANVSFTTSSSNGTPIDVASILNSAPGEPNGSGGFTACSGNLRPWFTVYWQRPDGGTSAPANLCMGSCNP